MNGVQDHELPHLDQSRLQHAVVPGLPVDAESLLVTLHFSGREGQIWGMLSFLHAYKREKRREVRPAGCARGGAFETVYRWVKLGAFLHGAACRVLLLHVSSEWART